MERTATRRTHGADLSRYLAVHGPVDGETAAEILEQAAEKLDAAHAAGVVHGRLGPGAVLLDLEAGTVGVREPAGSPEPDLGFVAPEVRRGEEPSAAADVYSIGALLHLCLTGGPPRPGELRMSPLPAGTDEVVARAMRTEPDARHPSCGAVLDHLRRSLAPSVAALPMPEPDEPPSTEPDVRPARRLSIDAMAIGPLRGRALIAVAALVVAALAGALLVGLPAWQGHQGATAARDELVATIGLSGCRDTPNVTIGGVDGLVAAVDCDPDGVGAATVSYRRYADAATLEDAYRAGVAAIAPVGDTPCGADPAPERSQIPYEVHGTYLGNLLCDRTSGPPELTWTIDGMRLLGTATGDDLAALDRWRTAHLMERPWISDIVRAANATADPPFPNRAEAALLAEIPNGSRIDCSRLDRQFVVGNVGEADGVTAIACGPAAGASTIFYFRFADRARFAAFRGAGPGDAADCQSNPAGFNGSARYTRSDGSTGVLGCVQQKSRAAVVWTVEGSRTVGLGFGDDPGRLLDWWRADAGPT